MNKYLKIENFLQKNKLTVIFLSFIFLFIWIYVRPEFIKNKCIKSTDVYVKSIGGDQTDMRYFYWKCLAKKGISN